MARMHNLPYRNEYFVWSLAVVSKNDRFVWVIAWFVVIFGINTTSDILKYVISGAFTWVKFETILKYHEWYYAIYHKLS